MFIRKTLFVVGAGAGTEVKMPTGSELTATIAKDVDIKFRDGHDQFSGEVQITDALRSHVRDVDGRPGNINPYLDACGRIRVGMPQAPSIDSFIDHQRDDKIDLCGKLAIVHSILKAERYSLLFVDERKGNATFNFNSLKNTWYTSFMQIIADGHHTNTNQFFEGATCITFNYDRCIEHFLFHALQNYYGIQPAEAADIMQEFKIIHPYGMVGRMQWQGDEGGTPFGTNAGGERLLSLAGQIKTFTERFGDNAALTEIHQLVQEAEIIVFLGFAFHKQNIQLMGSANIHRIKRVLATAKGISKDDCEVIVQQIKAFFPVRAPPIPIDLRRDLGCHEFFDEYSRTLSQ